MHDGTFSAAGVLSITIFRSWVAVPHQTFFLAPNFEGHALMTLPAEP